MLGDGGGGLGEAGEGAEEAAVALGGPGNLAGAAPAGAADAVEATVVADPEVGVGLDRAAVAEGELAEGRPGGQAGRVAGSDLGHGGGAGGGGQGLERALGLLDAGLVGLADRQSGHGRSCYPGRGGHRGRRPRSGVAAAEEAALGVGRVVVVGLQAHVDGLVAADHRGGKGEAGLAVRGEDPNREDGAGVGVEQPDLVVLAGAQGWEVVGGHGHLPVAAVAGHAGLAAGGDGADPGQGDGAAGTVRAQRPGPEHDRRGHGQSEGGGQADQGPVPPARPGRPPARTAGLDGRPRRVLTGGGAGRAWVALGGGHPGNRARTRPGHHPGNDPRVGGRLGVAGGGAEGG